MAYSVSPRAKQPNPNIVPDIIGSITFISIVSGHILPIADVQHGKEPHRDRSIHFVQPTKTALLQLTVFASDTGKADHRLTVRSMPVD